jgi:hypothetical protein
MGPLRSKSTARKTPALSEGTVAIAPPTWLTESIPRRSVGHLALAEALEPLVFAAAGERAAALERLEPPAATTITEILPAQVNPGFEAGLTVRGRGFLGPARPARA